MFCVVLKALQSTENCSCSGKSTCCFRLEVNEFLQISDENKGLREVCNNVYFEQLMYFIIASKFPMSGQLFLFFKGESQVQQSQFMHSSPWLRQNSIPFFFFFKLFSYTWRNLDNYVSPQLELGSGQFCLECALVCEIPRHISGCETVGLSVYKS